MKFTILTDPSLFIIALYLICLIHALEKTRRGEEILHVHYMTTLQHKNPCPGGMKFQILIDSVLVIITVLSFCLIYAWVTHDGRRQPIAIGQLSYSGDLIMLRPLCSHPSICVQNLCLLFGVRLCIHSWSGPRFIVMAYKPCPLRFRIFVRTVA